MCVEKTKVLISCAVTAQLICSFVFALEKCPRTAENCIEN